MHLLPCPCRTWLACFSPPLAPRPRTPEPDTWDTAALPRSPLLLPRGVVGWVTARVGPLALSPHLQGTLTLTPPPLTPTAEVEWPSSPTTLGPTAVARCVPSQLASTAPVLPSLPTLMPTAGVDWPPTPCTLNAFASVPNPSTSALLPFASAATLATIRSMHSGSSAAWAGTDAQCESGEGVGNREGTQRGTPSASVPLAPLLKPCLAAPGTILTAQGDASATLSPPLSTAPAGVPAPTPIAAPPIPNAARTPDAAPIAGAASAMQAQAQGPADMHQSIPVGMHEGPRQRRRWVVPAQPLLLPPPMPGAPPTPYSDERSPTLVPPSPAPAPFSPTSAPTSVQRGGQQLLIAAEEMQGRGGLKALLLEAALAPEPIQQLAPESQVSTWMGGSARNQARKISSV